MTSLQLSKSDQVTSLVSHIFPDASITSIEDAVSSLTLEDKSTIAGSNTISTLLATPHGRVGSSDIEKAEVQQWLTVSAKKIDDENLLTLNTYLAQQTFLVANDWTVCDLAYYVRLHSTVSEWDAKKQSEYCHITRWFDHVQHLEELSSYTAVPKVDISQKFDKGVTVAIKVGAPKESIDKDATRAAPAQDATTPTSVSAQPSKQSKKDKKEKKAKEPKQAAAPAPEPQVSPAMISFKVGLIKEAILHPDADTLYVSTVDLGESSGPRTVVSGLVKYIPLAEMQGRRVVCVCNLKPANMRGIKSSAMVLAASPGGDAAKDTVELVIPPEAAAVGEVLTFEGFAGEPEAQLNPKKKVFETVQPGFTTNEQLEVLYRESGGSGNNNKTGRLCDTQGRVCRVVSLVGASIK